MADQRVTPEANGVAVKALATVAFTQAGTRPKVSE
jgi:hypothetical protein